ncbi:hypothetical protein OBP_180 [Pseudomonas phage OBP]|uniref:hypothetical protein n=1 Tax=Pseudomonas phage OBP TaxID=1124849 RepID=UPI000240D594|nr:hypothetical protein OBP_180 [Pseudomonas phage OBP]AEV89617.1 hypothetical protein OBP_180 [Pseudomonas phage OBP]
MATIQFKDVDFFGLKLLDKENCRFCVRSGKAFMYINNQRFDFEDTPATTEITKFGLDFEAVNMDTSKDVTVEGFIFFWQKESFYAAAIIDLKRKHPPIVIRAGDALKEIENE